MVYPGGKHCHLCPGNSSKGQAMVACIELSAGAFCPDTLCQKSAQGSRQQKGDDTDVTDAQSDYNLTRKGREGEQGPADPQLRAAAMERSAVCARTGASGRWR